MALVGDGEAGEQVEQGGLAGAVRADDAEQLALAEPEVDLVDRGDAAVALGDADRLERGRRIGERPGGGLCRRLRGPLPDPRPLPPLPLVDSWAAAPWRYTARRMSSRSSSSAVGPSKRTSPFSMNTARSARRSAVLTDCSTSTTVVPSAWMARTISSRSSTTVGARPSDSSSIIRRRGRPRRACDRLSICCSPPDRSPASVSQRRRRAGNHSRHCSWRSRRAAFSLRRAQPATRRFSATVSVGNTPRPPGHLRDAELGGAGRVELGDVLAGEAHGATRRRGEPGDGPQHRGLAGAVGAEERDHLALVDLEVDAEQHLGLSVGDVDPRDGQQRVGRHVVTSSDSTVVIGRCGDRLAVVVEAAVGQRGSGTSRPRRAAIVRSTQSRMRYRPPPRPSGRTSRSTQDAGPAGDQRPLRGEEELGAAHVDGAEDGAGDRGQSADDDHREEADAHLGVEGVGEDAALRAPRRGCRRGRRAPPRARTR